VRSISRPANVAGYVRILAAANNSQLGVAAPPFAQGKRTVAAGEKLGVVGRTGVTVGTHVYFEMLIAGRPVDPAPYLRVPKCDRKQ
jgi:septal ring factor EnvC (AmiA/AmiB activator)